jgi:hypothetical protein
MSVSAPFLDLAALQRLRTGAEVLTYGKAGREERWRAVEDYMYVPGRMRWAHVQTCETRTDDELVGAFLMSGGGGYRSGSAGMTSSSWMPSVPLAMSPAQWGASAPPAPRPPSAPEVAPRPTAPGMRALTDLELALLPAGSVLHYSDGTLSYAYEKNAHGDWFDHDGETLEMDGADAQTVLLRVGDGTQPGAYLAPDCSPDALVDLLLSRADLRDALAARVPALRDLADALRELVGLQGGGS